MLKFAGRTNAPLTVAIEVVVGGHLGLMEKMAGDESEGERGENKYGNVTDLL